MGLTSRCTRCDGTKKVRSIGNMPITCPECKGVGYTKIDAVLNCGGEPVKRGRKPNKDKVVRE
jgi:phage FluMu protein Com